MKHIVLSLLLAGFVIAGAPGGQSRYRPGEGRFSGSQGENGHHRQDRAVNGNYGATIGGFYKGTGTAEVSDETVSITATIVGRDGQTGTLVANDLSVDGPYFSGHGTVCGQTFLVRGRIDAARASRLTATFFLDDGRTGRIVAKLPSEQDPGDDGWNHLDKDTSADGD